MPFWSTWAFHCLTWANLISRNFFVFCSWERLGQSKRFRVQCVFRLTVLLVCTWMIHTCVYLVIHLLQKCSITRHYNRRHSHLHSLYSFYYFVVVPIVHFLVTTILRTCVLFMENSLLRNNSTRHVQYSIVAKTKFRHEQDIKHRQFWLFWLIVGHYFL